MRKKVGLVAFVLALLSVWGVGFLVVRGDLGLRPAASEIARPAEPSASASVLDPPAITAEPTPTPSLDPSAAESAASALTSAAAPVARVKQLDVNPELPRPAPQPVPPVAQFKVASFNILGSSHTGKGGHSPGKASGSQRMGGVLSLLASNDVSVVGMQEMQPDQRNAFTGRAPGWTLWPGLTNGRSMGENSIAWRDDTWEAVERQTVPIPYFNGRIRPMPYVLLQHRETGIKAWFSTFHNPADVHGPAQRWRNEATSRQINLFNRLEATGFPQFVTGDMNERSEYSCRVTRGTALLPAQGGSCPGNAPIGIDWIFASPKVEVLGYQQQKGGVVASTSDHPFLVADVRVDGIDYAAAVEALVPEGPQG